MPEKKTLRCASWQNNDTDIFLDMSEQDIFSWDSSNMHFRFGTSLSLACETGGTIQRFGGGMKLIQEKIFKKKKRFLASYHKNKLHFKLYLAFIKI